MNESRAWSFFVDAREAVKRLDLYLVGQAALAGQAAAKFSRAEIQRLITEGQVTLNGAVVKASARLKPGDRVEMILCPPRDAKLSAEKLPLDILYEDQDCLVLNKAPGLTVHPGAGHAGGTLVNALLHHCPDIEGIGGERRPGIVHRLDKETSGVMVVAKNAFALQKLVQQFKDRSVEKGYVAVAWGKMKPQKGVIDRPIGRHRSDRKKMSSRYFLKHSRPAVTTWTVMERFILNAGTVLARYLTLLQIQPRTGRTHQIRVHLADIGYPLVGDRLYGYTRNLQKATTANDSILGSIARQALHAEKLVFTHPRTGRRMEFIAPLADDMVNLLRRLRESDCAPPSGGFGNASNGG